MSEHRPPRDPNPPQRRYPKASPWGIRAYQRLVRAILSITTQLSVRGVEHVPEHGGCVIAFNHLSHLDGPVLFAVMPRHDVTAVVGAVMAKNPAVKFLIERTGGVWIERGGNDRQALATVLEELKRGMAVIVSPEGRISPTGALIEGQRGPVFLADKAEVPIIPVAMTGVEQIVPNLRRLRRTRLTVTIAPPIWVPPPTAGNHKARVQETTDRLMHAIAAMLPDEYRGHYREVGADHASSASAANA